MPTIWYSALSPVENIGNIARVLRAAAIAAAALTAASCGPSTAELATEQALIEAAQHECYDVGHPPTDEPAALAAAAPAAMRRQSQLTLRLRGGQHKSYEDEPAAPDGTRDRRYRLLVYARSQGMFAIRTDQRAGSDYVLVSDLYGRESEFQAMPYFSRSGARLVTLPGAATGGTVEIWKRNRDHYASEWRGAPRRPGESSTAVAYRFERWRQDDTIDLVEQTVDAAGPVTQPLTLRLSSSGWVESER